MRRLSCEGHSGFRWRSVVGNRVRMFRPIMSLAGLNPVEAVGVALYSIKASIGLSSARICLAMSTDFSAAPFDCGYLGLDVVETKPYDSANCLNSFELNWGAIVRGTLLRNTPTREYILKLVDRRLGGSIATHIYLYLYIYPARVIVCDNRSASICSHGPSGRGVLIIGSWRWEGRCSWQNEQDVTSALISLEIPGHHTVCSVLLQHLETPMCPLWSFPRICCRLARGTTIRLQYNNRPCATDK